MVRLRPRRCREGRTQGPGGLRAAAGEGGLFLLAQGPETLPVVGDRAKVLRIAQNLLLNALQGHGRGGRQGAVERGGRPLVSDRSGYRSGHKSPQALSGEGIGLSIVKRLCELLDASIEIDSVRGSGTTFRVTFPRSYATR